jgi:hypothetical protein
MAPKPKKMSDADKAYLKRLLKDVKQGTGAKADGSLSMDQKMALSALKRAADKASARGTATQAKVTARKPKAGTSTVSKVVGRAKTTAREARDVVTAVGTSARSRLNTRSYRSASGGLKSTPTSKANTAAADKNLKKQLKETAMAAMTGKKGTTSAQTGGKPSKKR